MRSVIQFGLELALHHVGLLLELIKELKPHLLQAFGLFSLQPLFEISDLGFHFGMVFFFQSLLFEFQVPILFDVLLLDILPFQFKLVFLEVDFCLVPQLLLESESLVLHLQLLL